MTTQISSSIQPNCASLEDCHTNFFALADLKGIRWRRLAATSSESGSGMHGMPSSSHQQHHNHHNHQQHSASNPSNVSSSGSSDIFEDPVLQSYSRCLSMDILCVWRRLPDTNASSSHNKPISSSSTFGDSHAAAGSAAAAAAGGRAQGPGRPSDIVNATSKLTHELWIFWYGEEPDLADVLSPELSDVELPGNSETALSYECRTLLFKAIHNLIERSLLSKGFARLGKWFVSPLTIPESSTATTTDSSSPQTASSSSATTSSSTNTNLRASSGYKTTTTTQQEQQHQFAFAFRFFVHGDSTVCTSVDVSRMPPIYRTSPSLVNNATADSPLKVILAPYGLSGLVVGQSVSYRPTDPLVQNVIDQWARFYPLNSLLHKKFTDKVPDTGGGPPGHGATSQLMDAVESACSSFSSSGASSTSSACSELPTIIEVYVTGVKCKYPAAFVFLADPPKRSSSSSSTTPPQQSTATGQCAAKNSVPNPAPGSKSEPPSISLVDESLKALREIDMNVAARSAPVDTESSIISESPAYKFFPFLKELTKNNFVQDLYANHTSHIITTNSTPQGSTKTATGNTTIISNNNNNTTITQSNNTSNNSSNNTSTTTTTSGGDPSHSTTTTTTTAASESATTPSTAERQFTWDYADPYCKANCTCYRCRMSKKQSLSSREALKISSKSSSTSLLSNNNTKLSSEIAKSRGQFSFHKNITHYTEPTSPSQPLAGDKVHDSSELSTAVSEDERKIKPDSQDCSTENLSSSSASKDSLLATGPSTHTPLPTYPYKSPAPGGIPSVAGSTTNAIDSPRSIAPIGTPLSVQNPCSVGGGGDRSTTPVFKVEKTDASSPYPNLTSVKGSGTLISGQILDTDPASILSVDGGRWTPVGSYSSFTQAGTPTPGDNFNDSGSGGRMHAATSDFQNTQNPSNTRSSPSMKRPLVPLGVLSSSILEHSGQPTLEHLYNFEHVTNIPGTSEVVWNSHHPEADEAAAAAGIGRKRRRQTTFKNLSSQPLLDSIDSVMYLVQSSSANRRSEAAPCGPPSGNYHNHPPHNHISSSASSAVTHIVDHSGNVLSTSTKTSLVDSSSTTGLSSQKTTKGPVHENFFGSQIKIDPYEFSDDEMGGQAMDDDSGHFNGQDSQSLGQKDDFTSTSPSMGGGLRRVGSPSEQEIKEPKGDLDQIFESDESADAASVGHGSPATPSGDTKRSSSNTLVGSVDSGLSSIPTPTGLLHHDGPTQIVPSSKSSFTELTRMYPTPPSLEQLLTPSPAAGPNHDMSSYDDHRDSCPCSPLNLDAAQLLSQSHCIYKPPVMLQAFMLATESKYSHFPDLSPPALLPRECIYQSMRKKISAIRHNQIPAALHHQPPQSILSAQLSGGKNTPKDASKSALKDPLKDPLMGYDRKSSSGPLTPGSSRKTVDGFATPSIPPPSPGGRGPVRPTSTFVDPLLPYPQPSPLVGGRAVPSPFSAGPPRSLTSNQLVPQNLPQSAPSSSVTVTLVDLFGLHVNLLLSDSLLNLFKDQNFDSCTICVCNMNTKGSDIGVYLSESLIPSLTEPGEQYRCSCGFSAVINRHRSFRSGLFWEDETEVTGIYYDPATGHQKKSLTRVSAPAIAAITHHKKETSEVANGLENGIDSSEQQQSDSKDSGLISPVDDFDFSSVELMQTAACSMFSTFSILLHGSQLEISSSTLSGLVRSLLPRNHRDLARFSPRELADIRKKCTPRLVEYMDATEMTALAMVMTRMTILRTPGLRSQLEEFNQSLSSLMAPDKQTLLHEWPFQYGFHPSNNADYVRFLRNVRPILQDSVQKRKTKEQYPITYSVTGPLTWRQFHKLSESESEDQCEPQPIPSLLVGHEKDWLTISPHALRYWDKLMLEPYTITKDITYIVVAPDNNCILSQVKNFFKELSCTYELMRLGRHSPIPQTLRDGILSIRKSIADKLADQPVDDWFNQIGDGEICQKLKQYAQACRHYLRPVLLTHCQERSQYEQHQARARAMQQSSLSPGYQGLSGSGGGGAGSHSSQSHNSSNSNLLGSGSGGGGGITGHGGTGGGSGSGGMIGGGGDSSQNHSSQNNSDRNTSEDGSNLNSSSAESGNQEKDSIYSDDSSATRQSNIVVYLVEPFTINSEGDDRSEVYRLATLGLLRCFTHMVSYLPEHLRSSVHVQIVSLDAILSQSNEFGVDRQDYLRNLSTAVFTQCRQSLSKPNIAKTLTGFGPAASFGRFLKTSGHSTGADLTRRVYAPILMLAPLKDKQTELGEMFGDRREKSSVLYCSYCLTEDQRFIVATVTNDRGDILEATTICISVPDRTRRRKVTARHFGLAKLMEFLISVMAESVQPWRLVIGRVGRVGHGEMKDWAQLLSKKALQRYGQRLKSMCKQCSATSSNLEIPCILSACLVSLEAETSLRVFPDQFTPDDRPNACQLVTPDDASCTHILTFPTSATIAPGQSSALHDIGLGNSPGDADLLDPTSNWIDDEEMDIGLGDNLDFCWDDMANPMSPTLQGVTGGLDHNPDEDSARIIGFGNAAHPRGSDGMMASGATGDEALQLLQQPLALGYYVSTAKTGPLPSWFWSSAPHMKESCPVFLKSALLIHVPCDQQNSDEFHINSTRNVHPLDSNKTTDVLRYVLEGYNSLSWLSLDASLHDRSSCLPIHIQVLMQVYRTVSALL